MPLLSHRKTVPTVWKPETLTDALDLLRRFGDDTTLVAGATLLQLDWDAGLPVPAHWIDLAALRHVDGLAGVSMSLGAVRIGALTSLNAVKADASLRRHAPMLGDAIRNIAASGIRNLATIGGNVAGRRGCIIPALLALDAGIEFFDGGTKTRPLSAWVIQAPGDMKEAILTGILLSGAAPSLFCYQKIGLRRAFSPAVIDAAGAIWLDASGHVARARLAVGGGIVKPHRLSGAEASLVGRSPDDIDWRALHAALLSEIEAPSDAFRSGDYRRAVVANALVAGLGGRAGLDAVVKPLRQRSAPNALFKPVAYREQEVSRATMAERWRMRPDVADKVAGKFAYLTDARKPGMLVGRILRAARPHAEIRSIDTSRAEALRGVHAVVTHRDVPGLNGFGIVVQDQPALCADKVRYLGDMVAAVAADNEAIAEEALSLIHVEYGPLPVVDDMEAALASGAPTVHEKGNLLTELGLDRGDVDAAWAQCAHIVEDTYITPRQMHGFMETEGGYVEPTEEGGIAVFVAGQHGFRDRMQLARILDMDEKKIRIVSSPSGGAFGGKDELTVQPALALLALKAKRAVRLQLDRRESVVAGTKRHPARIRMKTGCDADGRLLAQQVELLLDSGAYASLGPAVLETALEHVTGAYRVPNVRSHGRLAYTNNGFSAAFRGFGHNEMLFAVESQIGRLAEKAGLDPVSFRRRNLRQPGDRGFLGQVVAPSDRTLETLASAAASDLWSKERGLSGDGRKAIGVGLAIALQGVGLGSAIVPDDGGCRIELADDGKIDAFFGAEEIGQGVLALIQETVSRALGCDRDDVRPVIGDTSRTVDSGSTTASRMTYVVWRASRETGPAMRAALLDAASNRLGRLPSELAIGPGGFYDARLNAPGRPLMTFAALALTLVGDEKPRAACSFAFPAATGVEGNARFLHCHGATLARVAVDRVTGTVEVLDLDQHTAAGPVMDVANYMGQMEGGGVQGLGFTLSEDTLIAAGEYVTRNFDTYMMPTISDAPKNMRSYAMEELDPDDPFGPRGIGELGIAAVTPAIAAAVADAVGVWLTKTPFEPETILDAVTFAGGKAP